MGTLYLITSPAGKSYIGISSKTTEKRWAKHVEHAMGKRDNGALYAALRKYGPETFSVRTLVICDDWNYLCELEIRAIAAFGTRSPGGYNITAGGEGVTGERDDEFKRKVSVAQKKRFENPEERARMKVIANSIPTEIRRAAQIKTAVTIRTPEYRAKASESSKKQFSDYEARRKLGDALKAAYTDDMRQAASARMTELMADPKKRQAISDATRVAMRNPETAAKVNAAAKARATDPEWRRKISKSKTGKSLGPMGDEHKAKIAAARSLEWADPLMREKRLGALVKARETFALKKLELPHPHLQQTFNEDEELILKLERTRDQWGRYHLSFIHRISGGEERHRPKYFLDLESSKKLINSLPYEVPPVETLRGAKGTFAVKEIAYAYARWIDPSIRFDIFNQ
jgi:group I intron endonuclease